MSRIDEIISALQAVSADPGKAVEKHREATGKGAVGIMPVYSPEEMVHAAGYLPVGMWGGRKTISRARAHLPPFTCSIMQSVMELELEGAYDMLDGVVFSVPCDTLKCMSQKWKGKAPSVVFTQPQNRKIAAAVPFLAEEYTLLKKRLEAMLGVTISGAALENSINVYNENRRIMREFCDLACAYPQVINPVKRHAVIKARFFMEKSRHSALVRELIAEINKQPAKPWNGRKVVLTGIMAEPDSLLEILEQNGFAVAADDLAQESRQFRTDVPDGPDPLTRLARQWQDFDGCSLAVDPLKPRGRMLVDTARKYGADAVIICMMKFCDPEEWDYPIYLPQLEKAGIRNIIIEIDQEAASFEQVKTRIQTLGEILG
ncbi:MAG: 2-hydroxyacyl-CoA dehydratase family protein [Desulfovibrio sp.]|jgi:bcr-type benzoyl-CoA reductase subunit C|nr:2-hydroxyacyl-CoA dehydratase family protein [Desulfovibrio sp.]